MLGGSTGSTASHTTSNLSGMDSLLSTRTYRCNACDLIFEDSQAQRTHMREAWHIYNLKRRMESLPPVSADNYADNFATKITLSKKELSNVASSSAVMNPLPKKGRVAEHDESEEHSESEEMLSEQDQINSCLFCLRNSGSLEANVEHMSSEHGLFIPDVEYLLSLETIVKYLYTVVAKYNECLYCGVVKPSSGGTRGHMLDKGHCMINLEREPELLEFWEFSDNDGIDTGDDEEEAPNSRAKKTSASAFRQSSENEYMLASGKILESKSRAREAHRLARRTALASVEARNRLIASETKSHNDTVSGSQPSESQREAQKEVKDRTITKRDAGGLVGIPEQQMQSLVTLQRKMQRQQAAVEASASWADELGGRSQKHYKQKMNLRAG